MDTTTHRWHRLPLLVIAFAALGGCVSAGVTPGSVHEALQHAPLQPMDPLPGGGRLGADDYRVGPLDLLSVEVFDLPSLTREVRISAAGEIALPLVGRLPANGVTPAELEKAIEAKLKEGYLENPQVTVFVKEYMSQRVTVEGAVSSPGIYPLSGKTTLLQMVATAHGLVELANPAACVVFREMDGKRYAAVYDIRWIRRGAMADPELLGGDTVVVDFSGARSNFRDFLQTVPSFGIYRQISGR